MSPSPRTIIAFASAFYLLASTCKAVDFPENPALVSRLKTTNTYLDRMALFPNHTDWVYDFTTNPRYSWTPSSVCNANTATFPVLTDLGMTLAMLNLGPCSILPPHLHPRATNSVVAMAGSTNTYMIQENGARTVATNLTPGKMTVFPQGSLHTMQNIGCTDAQLVSALSSEDPGTLNGLWSFPQGIVESVLHGIPDYNATASRTPPIGSGSNDGPEARRKKCGL